MKFPQGKFYVILNPSNRIMLHRLDPDERIEDGKILQGPLLTGKILDSLEGHIHDAINLANKYRAIQKVTDS